MIKEKKRIAFCGTRGLPANYGGFETAVDEITKRFVENGYECDVFCRNSSEGNQPRLYQGRKLIYVKGSKKRTLDTFVSSVQTSFYIMKHRKQYDYIFWFNNANILGILLTLITGIPLAVNTDGLEWRRAKWSFPFKAFYFISSFIISLFCKRLISDSKSIQEYYKKHFFKSTTFIAYGSPEKISVTEDRKAEILKSYNLEDDKYFLQITRFEPDNLPYEIAMQFSDFNQSDGQYKMVIVGYKDATSYASKLKKMSGKDGIVILDAIYDKEVLAVLRESAFCYIHGNSVGGTNPALLEAMKCCKRVMAIDGPFSKEVLGEDGLFFDPMSIDFQKAINSNNQSEYMNKRLTDKYDWNQVASKYIDLVEA